MFENHPYGVIRGASYAASTVSGWTCEVSPSRLATNCTPSVWLRLRPAGSADGFHRRVTAGSCGRWPGTACRVQAWHVLS
jgi:hypothetical protein